LEYSEAHKKYNEALANFCPEKGEDRTVFADFVRACVVQAGDKAVAAAPISSAELRMLEERATCEVSQGLLDQAISTLTQALLVRKQMLAILKECQLDCTEEVRALVHLLQRFGGLFHMKGDDVNAERAFKESERLLRKGCASTTNDLCSRIRIFQMSSQHPSLACFLG
jgi:hypothetical protein